MQPRVPGPEVVAEPVIEAASELLLVDPLARLVFVHDVADFLQKTIVVGLVVGILVVPPVAHDLFFQRKMGGNAGMDLTEKVQRVFPRAGPRQGLDQFVQQADQFAVLVVDRGDPHRIMVMPLKQCHTYAPSQRAA